MRTVIALAVIFTLVACGTPRRFGDPEGNPVTVHITLDRAYVRALADRRIGTSVGAGASFGSGGSRSSGVGVGLSFSSTTVTLLGGDGPAQGQVFRKQIAWGDSSFTVPLTPGRELDLTVQVSGGHQGWESIGKVVIPQTENPSVTIVLTADTISATAQ